MNTLTHFTLASAIALAMVVSASALPPDDAQCLGYGYTRSFVVARAGSVIQASSAIGGFNPCSFTTTVNLSSKTRTADPKTEPWNAGNADASTSLAIQQEMGDYKGTATYGVQDDTTTPWVEHYPNYKEDHWIVKPIISGPTTVWWFNGPSPANFPTQITLSSDAGSATAWTVSQGATKVSLSTASGSQTVVSGTGSVFSTVSGDISITATSQGVSSDLYAITSLKPAELFKITPTIVCDGTFGYATDVPYTIYDTRGVIIEGVIPVSENWTASVVFDYVGSGWSRGPVQGGLTDVNGLFHDHITGQAAGYAPPAGCTGTAVAVMHWGQEWRVGSTTSGAGASVQTDTLRKYTQHAEVTFP
jgi:hypothetical protein